MNVILSISSTNKWCGFGFAGITNVFEIIPYMPHHSKNCNLDPNFALFLIIRNIPTTRNPNLNWYVASNNAIRTNTTTKSTLKAFVIVRLLPWEYRHDAIWCLNCNTAFKIQTLIWSRIDCGFKFVLVVNWFLWFGCIFSV